MTKGKKLTVVLVGAVILFAAGWWVLLRQTQNQANTASL